MLTVTAAAGGNLPIELLLVHSLDRTRTVGAVPAQDRFGMSAVCLITAGDPSHFVMYLGMSKLGRGRMPHLGSQYVDRAGAELIAKWIESFAAFQADPGNLTSIRVSTGNGAASHTLANPPADPLASPATALRTLRDIDQGRIDKAVANEFIARATRHADPVVRDLFERLLPEDRRVQRLGTNIDAGHLHSLAGERSIQSFPLHPAGAYDVFTHFDDRRSLAHCGIRLER